MIIIILIGLITLASLVDDTKPEYQPKSKEIIPAPMITTAIKLLFMR